MPSLQFKGRVFVENHHLAVPYHEWLPIRSKGHRQERPPSTTNLVIEGDNLAALKALLPTHHGKVKCIYIDPPYNTGKERWAYNDNVNSPLMKGLARQDRGSRRPNPPRQVVLHDAAALKAIARVAQE